MNTTGQRIKKAMADKGVKASQLASAVKATKGAVSQWVNDLSTPSSNNLMKIARYLGVSAGWLMGDDASTTYKDQPQANATVINDSMAPWDSSTPVDDDEVEVPFHNDVELAAGSGSLLTKENKGPRLRFSRSTLRRRGVSHHNVVCVTIHGSSMEPVLPDGCTVGIDTGDKNVSDGRIYALRQGDMVRIKALYRLPNGGLRLRSYNHDEYPDEEYRRPESGSIVIIGRVFWYSVLI